MAREKQTFGRRLAKLAALALALPVMVIVLPLALVAVALYLLHRLAVYLLVWALWLPKGKNVLVVLSESPIWQDYMTAEIVPLVRERAVVLNWSERKKWPRRSFARHVFRSFGGQRNFNPLVVCSARCVVQRSFVSGKRSRIGNTDTRKPSSASGSGCSRRCDRALFLRLVTAAKKASMNPPIEAAALLVAMVFAMSPAAAWRTSPAPAPARYLSPDKSAVGIVFPVGKPGHERYESRMELRSRSGRLLAEQDYSSVDGEHGYGVKKAVWTPDSNFFVYSLENSGGHSPWHTPVEFYRRARPQDTQPGRRAPRRRDESAVLGDIA